MRRCATRRRGRDVQVQHGVRPGLLQRSRATPAEKSAPRRPGNSTANTPPPANLPRVDTATQKGRDELRRKVLQDELAAEEKLLGDARAAYASGAPPPLPEERGLPQRYAERIARLRQSVQLHERNIEALRRELAASASPVTAARPCR